MGECDRCSYRGWTEFLKFRIIFQLRTRTSEDAYAFRDASNSFSNVTSLSLCFPSQARAHTHARIHNYVMPYTRKWTAEYHFPLRIRKWNNLLRESIFWNHLQVHWLVNRLTLFYGNDNPAYTYVCHYVISYNNIDRTVHVHICVCCDVEASRTAPLQ